MKKLIFTIWILVLALVTNINSAFSQNQWYWQNPMPQGNGLNSVFFVNNSTGWLVGEVGTILKTTNGGINWISQITGSIDLRSVYFINNNTGWIVGGGGTILKTTNSGVNWSAQSTGISSRLLSVQFINNNIGWATGDNGTILKTINGGIYWSSQTFAAIPTLSSVFFIDSNTGWTVGMTDFGLGIILKSTNGGINWNTQMDGQYTNLTSVFFVDYNTGWTAGDYGMIFKTINGGNDWSYQITGNMSMDNSLYFVDKNTGWIAGESSIYKTTNGGISWFSQTNNGIAISSIHFTDSNNGIASGHYDGSILKTTNGGNNWINFKRGTSSDLRSVHFTDSNTGWAVGLSGTILKTTNNGAEWISQVSGNNYSLTSVFFINYNTGWVVGVPYDSVTNASLLKTTNGGLNWSATQINEANYLFSVYFIDSNTGWIAGGDPAKILKTTNGGMNWSSQVFPGSLYLTTVCFTDVNTGWTVGGYPGGLILKTTDGGNSWMNKTSGTSGVLNAVHFMDNNTGWISSGEKIFKTTNGGTNWITQTLGPNNYANSIHFIDHKSGWIVGSHQGFYGIIFKTIDGGSNWINQSSLTNYIFQSVYFVNNNGWIVGDFGTILHTMEASDDIGVTSIIQPVIDSTYQIDCIHNTIIPKVTIENFGLTNQNNFFNVYCEIKQGSSIVYCNSKLDTIGVGQSHTISFDTFTINFDFNTFIPGEYSLKSWTSLASDPNRLNDTANSTFSVVNPNYGYSDISGYYFLNSSINAGCIPDQPFFNWEDTTGSVNLIVNGTAVVPYTEYNTVYSSGCFRLPDVLPNGTKFKFFGTCYDTIVIATNGIIGLGGSLTRMNYPFPVSIPSASAPKPAIFPFWYWLNYFDTDIQGRNLKYKVTDNKIIVTYESAPIYNNTIDSNDYVSFQVILETETDCGTENSKVTVQFDDSRCGSTFLNNYYNGQLYANTVGIQNASGTIAIQYRHSNSSQQLITQGPLFGSPFAIAFGQINSVLPVELTSFTSSVNENKVTLNWQTNREINNSGFNIERSVVKDQWINAGFVKGNGNTNSVSDYSFTDKNLVTGKYKYRLKQIDFNGSFEYFNLAGEVTIGIPDKYELSQNYPNPFNPSTVIRYSLIENSFTSLKIYDVIGREITKLVNEKQEAGRYEVIFNGSNFASGVYFYELRSGSFVSQKRMLLLK